MSKPATDKAESPAKKKLSQPKARTNSWRTKLSGLPPGLRDGFKRGAVLRAINRGMDETVSLGLTAMNNASKGIVL